MGASNSDGFRDVDSFKIFLDTKDRYPELFKVVHAVPPPPEAAVPAVPPPPEAAVPAVVPPPEGSTVEAAFPAVVPPPEGSTVGFNDDLYSDLNPENDMWDESGSGTTEYDVFEDYDVSEDLDQMSNVQVAGNVESWVWVNFSRMSHEKTFKLTDKLRAACVAIGMDFFPLAMRYHQETSAHPNDIEKALWGMQDGILEAYSEPGADGCPIIGLFLVILPAQGNHVKVEEVCEGLDMVCHCITLPDDGYTMPGKQYLALAAKEINRKILNRKAGILEPLRHTAIPFVSDVPTVIFGAHHSYSRAADYLITITSVVASMDWPGASNYKTSVCCQESSPFTMGRNPVGSLVWELLLAFRLSRKQLPQRIIFFSNELTTTLFKDGLADIREACFSLEDGYDPKITFICV